MSNFVEQRSAIKFSLRNDISAAETYRMLRKDFGDETMSQKNVYKLYRDFKEGRKGGNGARCLFIPCDFWLFPKPKRPLRGNRFKTIEEIERETVRALKAILTDDFSAYFEDWRKRWHKRIGVGGL